MSGIFITILVIYFLPMLIAGFRNHNNLNSIIALNILGGWTIVGWVVCFVWAVAKAPATTSAIEAPAPSPENKTTATDTPLPVIDESLVTAPVSHVPKNDPEPTPQRQMTWVDRAKAEIAEERKRNRQ